MRKLIAVVLVTAFTVFISTHASAEQDSGKLLLGNDQLRAVEYIIQAGGKLNLEAHAPYLSFCENPFAATLTFRDGKKRAASFKVDDVRWYQNPIVSVANTGKIEGKFLIIELKKPAPTSLRKVASDDGTKVAPDTYKLLYENARVRVIRVGTKPGQKTPMHSHPGSSFRYSMANVKAIFTFPDGTTRELENKSGEARWTELPARHAHENIGTTKRHTLLVEIR